MCVCVGGGVFGLSFVMQYFVSFLFLQSYILAEEERTGCLSLIAFLLSCGSKCYCKFSAKFRGNKNKLEKWRNQSVFY